VIAEDCTVGGVSTHSRGQKDGATYTFECSKGDAHIIDEISVFRYETYSCEDKSTLFPTRKIVDEYDEKAVHFIARKEGNIVGTLRARFSTNVQLEASSYIDLSLLTDNYRIAEVSKLIVKTGNISPTVTARLFNYAKQYGKKENIQYIVIFFHALDSKQVYFRKMGFQVGTNEFVYENHSGPFGGLVHKMGIMQL